VIHLALKRLLGSLWPAREHGEIQPAGIGRE
jgi:hypothetical protein